MAERWRSYCLLLRWSFAADKRASVGLTLLNVATMLVGVAMGPALKVLIDRAGGGASAGGAAIVLGLLVAAQAGSGLLVIRAASRHQERSREHLDAEVMRIVAAAPGLELHENPAFQDQLEMLRDDQARFGQVLTVALHPASMLVVVVASSAVLVSVHPLLGLFPALTVISTILEARAATLAQQAWQRSAPTRRRRRYFFDLATQPQPGAEVRLNGLQEELLDRFDQLSDLDWAQHREAERRTIRWTLAGRASFSVAFVAATLFVAQLATSGRATAGDLVLTITVAAQVSNRMSYVVSHAWRWAPMLETAARFAWLLGYDNQRHADDGGSDAPGSIERDISLSGVSFSYPGLPGAALSNVDLSISRGQTVAIVGDNGAGKSTLVKLLLRFYEPGTGRILVDGDDLNHLSARSWRERTSGAFQDFARPELVARQAVGIGDLPFADDDEQVMTALERAGAQDLPAGLPAGLESRLGRSWEGGAELSGGQWQKLAMARGMMRQSPALLVLDEPTSNLDAETEHRLFARYASAARRERQITILVSHRFSTVRMADLIVVVVDGRVVESGDHYELMARDGPYHEMFSLQARGYDSGPTARPEP